MRKMTTRSCCMWIVSAVIGFSVVVPAMAAGKSYKIEFKAGDPTLYPVAYPCSLPCPNPLGGTAEAPLPNATYADGVKSLAPFKLALGQVVPFEVKVTVKGGTDPENGVIDLFLRWDAVTTAGERFGYDDVYGVYCAFVDTADPDHYDPGGDATLASFSWFRVGDDPAGPYNEILGLFRLAGLDDKDEVVLEIWMVLKDALPGPVHGTAHADVLFAQTAAEEEIKTGAKTIPLRKAALLPTAPAIACPPDVTAECAAGATEPDVTGWPTADDEFDVIFGYTDHVLLPGSDCLVAVQQGVENGWAFTVLNDASVRLGDDDDSSDDSSDSKDSKSSDSKDSKSSDSKDSKSSDSKDSKSSDSKDSRSSDDKDSKSWKSKDSKSSDDKSSSCWKSKDSKSRDDRDSKSSDSKDSKSSDDDDSDDCLGAVYTGGQAERMGDGGQALTGLLEDGRVWNLSGTLTGADGTVMVITGGILDFNVAAGELIGTLEYQIGGEIGSFYFYQEMLGRGPANRLEDDGLRTRLRLRGNNWPTAEQCRDDFVAAGGTPRGLDLGADIVCPPADGIMVVRVWTAKDLCGNRATCTQIILLEDTVPPDMLGVPTDETVECGDAIPEPEVRALDACDGEVDVLLEQLRTDGLCPTVYTLTRTWTAEDRAGHVASATQVVTVMDLRPPVLTAPVDVTLACGDSSVPDHTGAATAADTCDDAPTVSYLDDVTPGPCPQGSLITRVWTAIDACGNSASAPQFITVSPPPEAPEVVITDLQPFDEVCISATGTNTLAVRVEYTTELDVEPQEWKEAPYRSVTFANGINEILLDPPITDARVMFFRVVQYEVVTP